MNNDKLTSIDTYIAAFPVEIQEILQKIRVVIAQNAPDASEKISYQMPTFYLNGNLLHFAAYKNHIGLYPAPDGIEAFKDEIAPYKHAKGSIKFPLDQPIPYELIGRIAAFRAESNRLKKRK